MEKLADYYRISTEAASLTPLAKKETPSSSHLAWELGFFIDII